MRSVLAYHEAFRGASRKRCVDLACRALQDGWLLRRSTELIWILHVAVAFTYADEFEQSARVLDEALTEARRRGEAQLRHAVAVLQQSGAQLEYARALIDLGVRCAGQTVVAMRESLFCEAWSSPTGSARRGSSSMRKTNWPPRARDRASWP
jgi:hypothetical protein